MTKRNRIIEISSPSRMRQVVFFARVSSREQDKEGFSIPAQLKLSCFGVMPKIESIHVTDGYINVKTARQAGRYGYGKMVYFLRKH